MTPTDLYIDICLNFRKTEDSVITVSKWGWPKDPYLPTIPPALAGRGRERAAYFTITAERILWRKKILGIAVDATLAANPDILNSRPFGENTPMLEELLAPNVAIAASLIPLVSRWNISNDKPVLARLYCVKGLAGRFPLPFSSGGDSTGISAHTWFIAGVNGPGNAEMIDDRSWLLAAHLLMRIVAKEDKSARENLARNFIVTGDVKDGQITRVGKMEMKLNFAKDKEFKGLKWIMPTENANSAELENTMKNRIEKPATLEEAYELIKSMRNRATRSFFRFLKESNLEGMKEQFAIGADIYADDAETKKGALQLVAEKIAKEEKSLQGENSAEGRGTISKKIDALNGIRSWLYLNGFAIANAKTIYAMAKNGMDKILEGFLLDVPIDARDEEGLTAVDWALIEKEWDLARQLHEHGGHCDVNSGNKALGKAIASASGNNAEARTFVLNALKVGFDPDSRDLFSSAIRKGDVELAKACIDAGRTPSAKLSLENAILIVAEDKTGKMSPQKQDEMINMLRQYVAAFSPEMIEKIKTAKAKSLIYKALARNNADENLNKARSAIEDGILPINAVFDYNISNDYFTTYYKRDMFAIALKEGWCSIVKACLEKGASPTDFLTNYTMSEIDVDWCRPKNQNKEPYDPISFVKESKELSSTQKRDILALLRKYWPQEQPLPENAFL